MPESELGSEYADEDQFSSVGSPYSPSDSGSESYVISTPECPHSLAQSVDSSPVSEVESHSCKLTKIQLELTGDEMKRGKALVILHAMAMPS